MKTKKTEYQLTVIHNVRNLREANNATQSYLCDILNISEGHVGNIESPKFPHKYTLKQLQIICEEFGFPIHLLFLTEEECNVSKEELIKRLITKIVEYDG